jgi:hypothetical protein
VSDLDRLLQIRSELLALAREARKITTKQRNSLERYANSLDEETYNSISVDVDWEDGMLPDIDLVEPIRSEFGSPSELRAAAAADRRFRSHE